MYSETLSTGICMTSDLIWAYTGILTAPTAYHKYALTLSLTDIFMQVRQVPPPTPSLSNAGILMFLY